MKLKRKILSVASAVVCGFNLCFSRTGALVSEAVKTVPEYNNVDNYVADCLLTGYISLETGESEGAGFYNLEDEGYYAYEAVAEYIMEELNLDDPADFRNITDSTALSTVTDQELYQLLLADYFTFETEDSSAALYNEAFYAAKKEKFQNQILKELVKAGTAKSEEEALKLIESTASADNTKASAAIKKLGYENDLSAYTNAKKEISAARKAADYFEFLTSALAVNELNQDKISLLAEMKNTANANDDFCKAIDAVAEAMEKSYADISVKVTDEKIANAAVTAAVNEINSAYKIDLDSILSADNNELATIRILLQYSFNQYAKDTVIQYKSAYDKDLKEASAEDFHSALTNYAIYQEYSALTTVQYAKAANSEVDTESIENETAAFQTEIALIYTWYVNYLDYTGVNTTEDGIPEGAVEYNGHYYLVFNNSISWIYAKEYCELMGGHLATVTDANEQKVVEKVAKDCTSAENFWIGGYKDKKTNKWLWVDNTPFEYTNWDNNQPDFFQNEEYYIRFTNADITYGEWTAHMGKWNDCANEASGNNDKGNAVSIQTFAFICEWDSAEAVKNYLPGDANLDGKVNVRDAAFIASALAKNKSDTLPPAADFNDDGKINVRDAAAIASYLAQSK